MTVFTLSDYQITTLSGYFKIYDIISKIGLVKETGNIIIEFSGSCSEPRTASIPRIKPDNITENAEFEIIHPKQITQSK